MIYINNFQLSIIAGHGITDIIDYPFKSIMTNFKFFLLMLFLNDKFKEVLLIIFSIIHFSEDIFLKINKKYKLIISILFHNIMIHNYKIAINYLFFFHTPRHYYFSIIKKNKEIKSKILKIFSSLTMSGISLIFLKNNYIKKVDNYIGKNWWISPILSHIYINNFK